MTSCKCIKVSRPNDGKPQIQDSEGVWRDANVEECVCVCIFVPVREIKTAGERGTGGL